MRSESELQTVTDEITDGDHCLNHDLLHILGIPLAAERLLDKRPNLDDLRLEFQKAALSQRLSDREVKAFKACAWAINHYHFPVWENYFTAPVYAKFLEIGKEEYGSILKLRRIAADKLAQYL